LVRQLQDRKEWCQAIESGNAKKSNLIFSRASVKKAKHLPFGADRATHIKKLRSTLKTHRVASEQLTICLALFHELIRLRPLP
jgi:hypothetical protein